MSVGRVEHLTEVFLLPIHEQKEPRILDRPPHQHSGPLSQLGRGGRSGAVSNLLLLWVSCLTIGFGGVLWSLFDNPVAARYLLLRPPYLRGLLLVITAFVFAMGWMKAQQIAEPPDLELAFIYPQSASILIANLTDKVVHKPKYQVILWNLNHVERKDPLPIPVATGNFIRPHAHWGPNQMIAQPQVQPLIGPGDQLFGFALVSCPDCKRERYYWVFIEHGKGGWYFEVPADKSINFQELFRQLPNISRERGPMVRRSGADSLQGKN